MHSRTQIEKARDFLAYHHHAELLVLPNIWDPAGARLLESLGYPAVATASAAVAYSRGLNDGEEIGFDTMLEVIERIASCVEVPMSADVEGGYADTPDAVAGNIREVLRAGAVGVNLEDSTLRFGPMRGVDTQCERLRAVREMAEGEGIHLVINARIDLFLGERSLSDAEKLAESIARAKAYLDAGADCVYPIGAGDLATLSALRDAIQAPINVYASATTASMRELEEAGVSRLSIGPGLFRAGLTAMKRAAEELQHYGSYDPFTKDALSSDEIVRLVVRDDPSAR